MSATKTQHRPWTRVEERRLVDARRTGTSYAELAVAFGRSEPSIKGKLVELRAVARRRPRGEVPRLVKKFYRLGLTDTDIADLVEEATGRRTHYRQVGKARIALGLPAGTTQKERARIGSNYRWACHRARGQPA